MFDRLLPLTLCLGLAACVQDSVPPEEESPPSGAAVEVEVERAYSLEDPREEDFKARIATEAALACGSARHRVQSSRPLGQERIGDDFLYRRYAITLTCLG